MSFKDKVVIVTGASSGIGAAIAEGFSAEGAKVVMVGRNEQKLKNVAARCNSPLVIFADVGNDEDVRSIINKTIEKYGKLDILINNAGTSGSASLLSDELLGTFDKAIRVNLRAVVYLTSLAAPYIIKTKGNIINISSILGIIPPLSTDVIAYTTSKAALNHFTICSASELAPLGVRVNAISPGPVVTDFLENTGFPGTWDEYKNVTATKKLAQPKEIADLTLFLASDKAISITGANYSCDNGISIKRR